MFFAGTLIYTPASVSIDNRIRGERTVCSQYMISDDVGPRGLPVAAVIPSVSCSVRTRKLTVKVTSLGHHSSLRSLPPFSCILVSELSEFGNFNLAFGYPPPQENKQLKLCSGGWVGKNFNNDETTAVLSSLLYKYN